ncbi:hypothetical protein D6833_09625 [Candidatus Parcubacteria bacterium]|nr:MAG: hypothetical protein D6833_09625 [Candidatus Parcubacteria bacterium]
MFTSILSLAVFVVAGVLMEALRTSALTDALKNALTDAISGRQTRTDGLFTSSATPAFFDDDGWFDVF